MSAVATTGNAFYITVMAILWGCDIQNLRYVTLMAISARYADGYFAPSAPGRVAC